MAPRQPSLLRPLLAAGLVLTLAACGDRHTPPPAPTPAPPIVVPLARNAELLSLAYDEDGVQFASLCQDASTCKPAPNGTYKTRAGTVLHVRDGRIFYRQRPDLFCSLELINGHEKVLCEDRD